MALYENYGQSWIQVDVISPLQLYVQQVDNDKILNRKICKANTVVKVETLKRTQIQVYINVQNPLSVINKILNLRKTHYCYNNSWEQQ